MDGPLLACEGVEAEVGGGYRARVERLDGLRIARVRLLPRSGAPSVASGPRGKMAVPLGANGAPTAA